MENYLTDEEINNELVKMGMKKQEDKEIKEEKSKASYIFGDWLGNVMSKVDMRTQYESGLLSMSLMMIGLILMIIYIAIYMQYALWYKIFLIVNLLAGLVFFMSNLTSQFQQYQNYMEVHEFNENAKRNI